MLTTWINFQSLKSDIGSGTANTLKRFKKRLLILCFETVYFCCWGIKADPLICIKLEKKALGLKGSGGCDNALPQLALKERVGFDSVVVIPVI